MTVVFILLNLFPGAYGIAAPERAQTPRPVEIIPFRQIGNLQYSRHRPAEAAPSHKAIQLRLQTLREAIRQREPLKRRGVYEAELALLRAREKYYQSQPERPEPREPDSYPPIRMMRSS